MSWRQIVFLTVALFAHDVVFAYTYSTLHEQSTTPVTCVAHPGTQCTVKVN